MKVKIKKSMIIVLTILIICGLGITSNAAVTNKELKGQETSNAGTQNYSRYASCVYSYLYENEDKTLIRVEYISQENKILIENYDSSFNLKSSKKIINSLPLFGGFYSGTKYNFVVTGSPNLKEEKTKTVYRIEKYSKDWKKLGSVDLKDCNTVIPFLCSGGQVDENSYYPSSAGSCRIAENDGTLYIETCHQMYKANDGFNHQANLGIEVNIETMKITYSRSGISNSGTGYSSHSFNQFIQAKDEYSYTVNHGDAYPRSIILTKRKTGANYAESYANILKIKGEIGDNNTGVSIGGLELSNKNCIVVGNSINQKTSSQNFEESRNIFITITPQNSVTDKETTIKWLTNYGINSQVNVSTPQLVKMKDNQFAVMWEEIENYNYVSTKVVLVDENGKQIGNTKTINARLSDCKPIIYKDNIVWYSGEQSEKPTIYSFNFNTSLGDINEDSKINTKDAREVLLAYIGKTKLTVEQKRLADVNKDGKVNTKDARQILLYYIGKIKNF